MSIVAVTYVYTDLYLQLCRSTHFTSYTSLSFRKLHSLTILRLFQLAIPKVIKTN